MFWRSMAKAHNFCITNHLSGTANIVRLGTVYYILGILSGYLLVEFIF